MFKRLFLCVVRSIVQDIISQVNNQVNVVNEQVQNRLQSYTQEVMNGIWQGQGANKFVEVISQQAMPELQEITGVITHLGSSVRSAAEIIDEADARARAAVDGLVDIFQSI